MGTPEFAVPTLNQLNDKVELIAVITQPDKPRGRGHKLLPSPVKVWAIEHNIPVLQPQRVKNQLQSLNPDLIIVVAFGQILPKSILEMPKLGCINVHASLLPKYRGAAPIHWAIINGETKTGVTTMLMDVGLDTGDMLLKREVDILDDTTLPELHDKLKIVGAELLIETIERLDSITPQKQVDAQSTYAPMLTKSTGLIDWNKSAQSIHNLVRGLYGGAYAIFHEQKYKIYRTRISKLTLNPAQILIDKNSMFIGTSDNSIEILEIQAPNSKMMSTADFLRGHSEFLK